MLLAVILSACSTFVDYQTYYLAEETTTTLVVKFEATATAEKFAALKADLNRLIDTTPADDPHPHITKAEWSDTDETPTLTLTLANVPDQVITIDTKPFTIVRTQTVFNPISLLPESADFTYYIGFTATRRHSHATTEQIQAQDDGTYLYIWDNGADIVFTDNYPNPPLYYILVAVTAVIVGVAVYLICRRQAKHQPRAPIAG